MHRWDSVLEISICLIIIYVYNNHIRALYYSLFIFIFSTIRLSENSMVWYGKAFVV